MLKDKGHYYDLLLFFKNKIFRLLVPYFVMGGGDVDDVQQNL